MITDPEVRAIAAENLRQREAARRDLAERMREAESRGGVRPSGATLGERVRNSAALERYRELAARGGRPTLDVSLPGVLNQRELIAAMRTRATVDLVSGDGLAAEDFTARLTTVAPMPARIPSLIRVIPTDELVVHGTETGAYTGSAGGVPEGSSLPKLTNLTLTDESIKLGPWGVAGEVTRGHVRDRGAFSEVVERIFRREYLRALEAQILAGDGSSSPTQVNFTGIKNTAGVPSFARSTGTRLDAVAQGQETVQSAGFDERPLALVAHPTTLRAVFGEAPSAHVRELLYAVGDVIPTVALPAGTAVIGDFYEGTALWVYGGLTFEATDSHGGNFLAGIITLRLDSHLAYRTVNPPAFCVVTGL